MAVSIHPPNPASSSYRHYVEFPARSRTIASNFGVRRCAMEDLQRYAGESWVRTFAGELDPQALAGALAWASAPRPPLDLSELDWDRVALRTLRAFTAVCTRVPARTPARAPLPTFPQPETSAEARDVRRPAPSRLAKPDTRPAPKS